MEFEMRECSSLGLASCFADGLTVDREVGDLRWIEDGLLVSIGIDSFAAEAAADVDAFTLVGSNGREVDLIVLDGGVRPGDVGVEDRGARGVGEERVLVVDHLKLSGGGEDSGPVGGKDRAPRSGSLLPEVERGIEVRVVDSDESTSESGGVHLAENAGGYFDW